MLYIRRACDQEGIEFLKTETSVYYEPFGEDRLFLKPVIDGAWIQTSRIRCFEDNYAKKVETGLHFKVKNVSELFAVAMMQCEQSDVPIVPFMFEGNSTYECSNLNPKNEMVDPINEENHLKFTSATTTSSITSTDASAGMTAVSNGAITEMSTNGKTKSTNRHLLYPEVASMLFTPRPSITPQMLAEVDSCFRSIPYDKYQQQELQKQRKRNTCNVANDSCTQQAVSIHAINPKKKKIEGTQAISTYKMIRIANLIRMFEDDVCSGSSTDICTSRDNSCAGKTSSVPNDGDCSKDTSQTTSASTSKSSSVLSKSLSPHTQRHHRRAKSVPKRNICATVL